MYASLSNCNSHKCSCLFHKTPKQPSAQTIFNCNVSRYDSSYGLIYFNLFILSYLLIELILFIYLLSLIFNLNVELENVKVKLQEQWLSKQLHFSQLSQIQL